MLSYQLEQGPMTMPGIDNYGAFLFAGILLNLTPGNDTIYILSQSIARGRHAGIYSALGIGTGSIVHTLFAAFGLSLLIAQSMILFTVIKYAGVVYLAYVGITMLRGKSALAREAGTLHTGAANTRVYRDAVITNVFNPKVALFFIAFLPQFINPMYRNTVVPFLALGFTFTFTGILWCLVLATFAAGLSARLRAQPKMLSILTKTSGTILLGLGIKLAFAHSK